MVFLSKRERWLWFGAAVYTLSIYATLALARQATEWLRVRNLLRLSIAAVAVVVLAAVVLFFVRLRPSRRQWWALGAVALGYLAVLPFAKAPEEALHLIEYGVLALLVHAALVERGQHKNRPGWTAFAVTALAGLVDELIQGWLPSRFYDTRDVIGNAIAAALALLALSVVRLAGEPKA